MTYNPVSAFNDLLASDKNISKPFRKPFKSGKNDTGNKQPGTRPKRRV